MPAFRVKLGANELNCVDVPLNPTHSLTHSLTHFFVIVFVVPFIVCYHLMVNKALYSRRNFVLTVRRFSVRSISCMHSQLHTASAAATTYVSLT